ncbi:MAG: hypothetical protein Q4C66_00530 [Lachnospiraceae bacterium]|nr:hypothetical protein [Lachnospiraceae bacterium]
MYEYEWYQWILFFFCYCFFGWIFESTYVSLKSRRFVNRGFLRLPMLPLYGTGAVMMLFVSLPVKDNLVLVYFSGVVAATALEYVTGWGMEKLFKMRYWDYSNQRFNVKGYICLSSSIAWGFLTIFLTEVIHRPIEHMVLGMDTTLDLMLVATIGTAFAADTVESTRAALDLGRALEAMTRMKAELEEMQVQLALLKSELREQTEQRVAMAQEETALRIAEIRAEAASRMSGIKSTGALRMAEATTALASELKAELRTRLDEMKDSTAERLENVKDSAAGHLERIKDSASERMEGQRARELFERAAALTEKLEQLQKRSRERRAARSGFRKFYLKSLLRGNPGAVSHQYREALKELQEELQKRIDEKHVEK